MKEVLSMAGHCAAHAVCGVSSGEILIPIVGYVDESGKRLMERLAMGPVEAMSTGDKKMANLAQDVQGAVFIKDAMVELENGKTDCLIIDVKLNISADKRIQFLLPYRNAANDNGFAIHAMQIIDHAGFNESELSDATNEFHTGIQSHDDGRELWASSFEEKAGKSTTYYDGDSANTDISADSFEKLKNAPFLVFFLVAAADGKVDKKEVTTFLKVISAADYVDDALFRRVMTNAIDNLAEVMAELATTERDYLSDLVEIRDVLDNNFSAEDALKFKVTLVALGAKIAQSSGGFFGKKMCKKERATLALVAACLGISD